MNVPMATVNVIYITQTVKRGQYTGTNSYIFLLNTSSIIFSSKYIPNAHELIVEINFKINYCGNSSNILLCKFVLYDKVKNGIL